MGKLLGLMNHWQTIPLTSSLSIASPYHIRKGIHSNLRVDFELSVSDQVIRISLKLGLMFILVFTYFEVGSSRVRLQDHVSIR